MSSNSVYTNASLDFETNVIRLLEILDDNNDIIVCKFHQVSLENVPSYTALSYTWGSARDSKKILIDGVLVPVRKNIWNFLKQTRKDREWKFIWIDALCIDQDNPMERNHQVKMMRAIYSSVSSHFCSSHHTKSIDLFIA